MSSYPSASLLIIGNEILSGQTQDINVAYLARQLFHLGIDTKEVRMILDCQEAIIEAIHALKSRYTFVFTTGGIGPTHDDITAASVAKAFGVELYSNDEALRRLHEKYPHPKAPQALKRMSYIPQGALLIDNPVSAAPGFQMENVYVMAGIPAIMQAMFQTLIPRLKGGHAKKEIKVLCKITEGVIAQDLACIQTNHPAIEIGSYPRWADTEQAVMVVAKGRNMAELEAVQTELKAMCDRHHITAHFES